MNLINQSGLKKYKYIHTCINTLFHTNKGSEADQEEHTSPEESTTSDQEEQRHSEQETKHFVSEMQSRAAEPEDSVESASTKGSLHRKSKGDMGSAISRKRSQSPTQGAMKHKKRELEAAFL